jgi:hypothetical protein
MNAKGVLVTMNSKHDEDEDMVVKGIITTEIRCPKCGYAFNIEGDLDRTLIDCAECKTQLYVRTS